ncbi:MAG: GNAT family N-acetyltransferase [Prevotellaceae bacterium]|nr:GNAT family N-acetyltransferase [Prevotellaceae bacterium]
MPLKLTTYYHADALPPLPGTDTFHSTALFRLYEATPGYSPIMVVATDEGVPLAKLLGVVRKSVRLFPPGIIKRCEVYGAGEYFTDKTDHEILFAELLGRLTDEALRSAFLIEFRNLTDAMFGYRAFRQHSYFPINWARVYNSLHSVGRPEDRFSASRVRQVRKGLKNGAVVHEADTAEEIAAFARMIRRHYSSKPRRHLPSPHFFYQLGKQLEEGLSRIFIVTYKGKVIGGSACVYANDTAYLWFSGGLRKRYALQYPGILAVWYALTDAKRRGYSHLEFMDVGLPFRYHGYREFVLRFGGKQVSTRRWFRFRWRWLNKLLMRFYE